MGDIGLQVVTGSHYRLKNRSVPAQSSRPWRLLFLICLLSLNKTKDSRSVLAINSMRNSNKLQDCQVVFKGVTLQSRSAETHKILSFKEIECSTGIMALKRILIRPVVTVIFWAV